MAGPEHATTAQGWLPEPLHGETIRGLFEAWVAQPFALRFVGFCAAFATFVMLEWALRGRRELRFGQYAFLILNGLVGASAVQLLAKSTGGDGPLSWHPELGMAVGFLLGAGYGAVLLRANLSRPAETRLHPVALLFRLRFAVLGGLVGAIAASLTWARDAAAVRAWALEWALWEPSRPTWIQGAVLAGSLLGLAATARQLQRRRTPARAVVPGS